MLQGFFSEVPTVHRRGCRGRRRRPVHDSGAHSSCRWPRAGIAVTTIFTFVFAWNEFLYAFLLTQERWVTLPVRLGSTITPFQTDWGYSDRRGDGILPAAHHRRVPAPARDGPRREPRGHAIDMIGVQRRAQGCHEALCRRRPAGARRRLARRRAGRLLLDPGTERMRQDVAAADHRRLRIPELRAASSSTTAT